MRPFLLSIASAMVLVASIPVAEARTIVRFMPKGPPMVLFVPDRPATSREPTYLKYTPSRKASVKHVKLRRIR